MKPGPPSNQPLGAVELPPKERVRREDVDSDYLFDSEMGDSRAAME